MRLRLSCPSPMNWRIYVDGKLTEKQKVAGDTSNWHGSYQLALANELNNSRPWQGVYHLVAIYNRDLSPKQVEQNFRAGADVRAAPTQLARQDPGARHFETQIAPLLARHCLECHDSSSKEGGLDLSRRDTALAGGESGPSMVPGKTSESLLWEQVESWAILTGAAAIT